jgi:hypothetical protein
MHTPTHFIAGPIIKILAPTLALTCVVLIAACADDIEKLKLSEVEKVRILQLQNPFGENYVRFAAPGHGPQVALGLRDCNLYRAKIEQDVVTEWIQEKTLSTFYPLWSACSRESLKQDGQFIKLSFCKTPLGAGGGCAGGGGDFRSLNGTDWQVLEANSKWKNVDNKSQAEK